MFRVRINALWTKDFASPISKVLIANIPCDKETAYEHIRKLDFGTRVDLFIPSVQKARVVSCDLQENGCYVQVDQVGQLSAAALIEDFEDYFDEDMSALRIIYDEDSHVSKILEAQGYSFVVIEDQEVRDFVGAQMLTRGAKKVEPADWPIVKARLDKAIEENEERRKRIRAERAKRKQARRYFGSHEEE